NTSVGSPVRFVASASSPNGISSMTINVDSQDAFRINSYNLDTYINMSPGPHRVLVKAWDNRGNYADVPLNLSVGATYNSPNVGTQLTGTWNMMQAESGWGSCTECAGNVTGTGTPAGYAMTQHQGNPSLSGDATKFDIWGQYPYSNVLWNRHLIGDGSGRLDVNNIVTQVHHFKYDVWFYFTNAHAMEAIEFDINQFFGGKSFIWGHECRVLGGNMWDVWNNTLQRWESTGFPCYPNTNAWNHVVIEVERTWDDQLHYVYIELNGQRHWMNRYEPPTPTNWYGITINFQLDGNYRQEPYSAWLDKLSFSYW
ncbi:MAG TPA: hypothetical protein VGQ71_10640, partial [Terriglobales bacterium]|nr:hypothetical protein [Terriglobales bacterium]